MKRIPTPSAPAAGGKKTPAVAPTRGPASSSQASASSRGKPVVAAAGGWSKSANVSGTAASQSSFSHVKSRIDTGRAGPAAAAKGAVPSSKPPTPRPSPVTTPRPIAAGAPKKDDSAPPRKPAVPPRAQPLAKATTSTAAAAAGNPFSIRPQVSHEDFFGVERSALHDSIVTGQPAAPAGNASGFLQSSLVVSETTYKHHSSVLSSVSWQSYVLDDAPDLPPVHATATDTCRVLDAPNGSRVTDLSADQQQLSSILDYHRPSRKSIVLAALEPQDDPSPPKRAVGSVGPPSRSSIGPASNSNSFGAGPGAPLVHRPSAGRVSLASVATSVAVPSPPENSPNSGVKVEDPSTRPSRGGSGWFSSILSLFSSDVSASTAPEASPAPVVPQPPQAQAEASGRETTPPQRSSQPPKRGRTSGRAEQEDSRVVTDDEEPPRRKPATGPPSSSSANVSARREVLSMFATQGPQGAEDASPVPLPPPQADDGVVPPLAAIPFGMPTATPTATAADKTSWFKRAAMRLSGTRMSEELPPVMAGTPTAAAGRASGRRKSVVFSEQLEVSVDPQLLASPVPAAMATAPAAAAVALAVATDGAVSPILAAAGQSSSQIKSPKSSKSKSPTLSPKTNSSSKKSPASSVKSASASLGRASSSSSSGKNAAVASVAKSASLSSPRSASSASSAKDQAKAVAAKSKSKTPSKSASPARSSKKAATVSPKSGKQAAVVAARSRSRSKSRSTPQKAAAGGGALYADSASPLPAVPTGLQRDEDDGDNQPELRISKENRDRLVVVGTSISPSSTAAQQQLGGSVGKRSVAVSPGGTVTNAGLRQIRDTLATQTVANATKALTVRQLAAFLASEEVSFDPEMKKAQLLAMARKHVLGVSPSTTAATPSVSVPAKSKSKSRSRKAAGQKLQLADDDSDDDDEIIGDGPGSPKYRANSAPAEHWTMAELKSFAASKRVPNYAALKRKADLLQAIAASLA